MMREFILRTYTDDEAETCKRCGLQEIVRCKDCKHYRKIDNGGICVMLAREEKMTDDWFCADGERRDPCSSQDS